MNGEAVFDRAWLRNYAAAHADRGDGVRPKATIEDVTYRRLFARKGDTVTCENGHEICDAARDIPFGQQQSPKDDWTNWRQAEPAIGTLAPPCEVCGGSWFRSGPTGVQVHFSDGWRG